MTLKCLEGKINITFLNYGQFSEDTVFDLPKRTNLNKAAGPNRFDSTLLKYCVKSHTNEN